MAYVSGCGGGKSGKVIRQSREGLNNAPVSLDSVGHRGRI